MSTIVTRAGKGDTLSWTEMDDNFSNLNTDKIQSTNAGSTGNVLTKTAGGAEWAAASSGASYIVINVNSGSNETISGSFKRGTLTELFDGSSIASLPSAYTLSLPAGTYRVDWNEVSNGASCYIYNVTDSVDIISAGIFASSTSVEYFVITGTKTLDFRFNDAGFSGKSGKVFFIKMA
jgi:hypothetical protein